MLISHSHRFIFIHNYKVAGSSIRVALEKYTDKNFLTKIKGFLKTQTVKVKSAVFNIKPGPATDLKKGKTAHLKASEVKNILPNNIFSGYYKFGFVRDPWDWQVSQYEFAKRTKTHHQHEIVTSLKCFDDYLKWRINEDLRFQKDFFYDQDDKLLVDFVGKFENLENDFKFICNNIRIPYPNLPHKLNSKKKHYLTYYNEDSIELIYNVFRKDVEAFGYSKPVLSSITK